MLKKVGPNIWIPLVMVSFGIVMAAMAAIHDGAGLLAGRFFLGIAEVYKFLFENSNNKKIADQILLNPFHAYLGWSFSCM